MLSQSKPSRFTLHSDTHVAALQTLSCVKSIRVSLPTSDLLTALTLHDVDLHLGSIVKGSESFQILHANEEVWLLWNRRLRMKIEALEREPGHAAILSG
jgi:hypothetical protein